MSMYIINRKGGKEEVQFDKILQRIKHLSQFPIPLDNHIDCALVSKKVVGAMTSGMTTTQLDEFAAQTAAGLTTTHPDYSILAARIAISNHHKNTEESFLKVAERLYTYVNEETGKHAPLVSKETLEITKKHEDKINKAIRHEADFELFDYFGFKTLQKQKYLLNIGSEVVERPQHLLMRAAIGIHGDNIEDVLSTYHYMSKGYFIHASPTLFQGGRPFQQMASCFLLTMKDDSIDGIYETLRQCAKISQWAGGIGVSVHNIRASGSFIAGTGGISNGLIPMIKVFNETARYVDQGGGKRKGAFAIYLETHHADILGFLELKLNIGEETLRARDLFYALWISDLFMERVRDNADWTLMCPNKCPGLCDVYGDEYKALYEKYEEEGKGEKTIRARSLWKKILELQIQAGVPYMLFKDAVNEKSNQKNVGTIRSSNLCTEIVEYSSPEEIAVCNLASISLPKFVDLEKKEFDHQKLAEITKKIIRNLNNVIDRNFYPLEEMKTSNFKHRPVAIGVQGLAEVFIMLRIPYNSPEARKINIEIFETIYFASLTSSMEIAKIEGPYKTYEGSPISKGEFQFNLWGFKDDEVSSNRHDWGALRAEIKKHGVRNSLLVGPMPTATTANIFGNSACTEPIGSIIYTRRVLSGEFIQLNKFFVRDMMKLNLWNKDMLNKIILERGSIQDIHDIPEEIRELYKTVWDVPATDIIDMAADRGKFIDQSASLNLFLEDPSMSEITSLHFRAWNKKLKTGMYYLRTKPARHAVQFTADKHNKNTLPVEEKKEENNERNVTYASSMDNKNQIRILGEVKKKSPAIEKVNALPTGEDPNICVSCDS